MGNKTFSRTRNINHNYHLFHYCLTQSSNFNVLIRDCGFITDSFKHKNSLKTLFCRENRQKSVIEQRSRLNLSVQKMMTRILLFDKDCDIKNTLFECLRTFLHHNYFWYNKTYWSYSVCFVSFKPFSSC